MSIYFNETTRSFRLDAKDTSYMIQILGDEGILLHAYWGKRLPDPAALYPVGPYPAPENFERERVTLMDIMPQEYPTEDLGDFRESAFAVLTEGGHEAVSLLYRSHNVFRGKPQLPDLPATFGSEDDCETLEILTEDPVLGLQAKLRYTVFEDLDVITRSVEIIIAGKRPLRLCGL